MDETAISLHLIRLSADKSSPESHDIDYIIFVVRTICDFIQHAVEEFLQTHPHPSSSGVDICECASLVKRKFCQHCDYVFKFEANNNLLRVKSVNFRELNVDEQVVVHRDVSDLMDLLKQIRQKIGYHVCFLRGCRDTVPSFENGIAVIPLPDFRGRHYQEILSENNPDEMSSLGFAAGAALHEIGHLLGAFHSSHGIMSERPNAIKMLRNGMDGQTEGLPPDCYFDNYSLCLFAHGPFFNEPKDRSTCSPVLFKTSDKEVYLKCKDGILIVVVINDTAYRDLQIFNTMQTSAKLSIEERDWDLIQVYTSSYRVQHITK